MPLFLMLRLLGSCNFMKFLHLWSHIEKLCNLTLGMKTAHSTAFCHRVLSLVNFAGIIVLLFSRCSLLCVLNVIYHFFFHSFIMHSVNPYQSTVPSYVRSILRHKSWFSAHKRNIISLNLLLTIIIGWFEGIIHLR